MRQSFCCRPDRSPHGEATLNRATQKTDDGRKRHPLKAAVGERRRQHQVRMMCSVRTKGGNGCSRLLEIHAEAASFQYQARQDRDDAPRQPTPRGSQMSHAGVQTGDRKRESCLSRLQEPLGMLRLILGRRNVSGCRSRGPPALRSRLHDKGFRP